MPQTLRIPYYPDWDSIQNRSPRHTEATVATEQELLDFCNRVREAGGANILEELLPSIPGLGRECLIANALNFGCRVWPVRRRPDGLFSEWQMQLPENITSEQAEAIAEAVGSPVVWPKPDQWGQEPPYVVLPEHIGNAAHAFDERVAFTDYILKPWENKD